MDKGKTKIAVLGATGHIAKGLIYELSHRGYKEIYLYTRNIERCSGFIAANGLTVPKKISSYKNFGDDAYDVILNCTGVGSPKRLVNERSSVFLITEEFDNLIIGYISKKSDVLYINLSSGAVYGGNFEESVNEKTITGFCANNISADQLYGIAKLNSEAKHRSLQYLNIVDLRVFAYFSRFIDLDDNYMMCEVVSCIKQNKELKTSSENIFRDYVTPHDLLSLIESCMKKRRVNDAFDVFTKEPVDKLSILKCFAKNYGLNYVINDDFKSVSPTGFKMNYFSVNRRAAGLGFSPEYTSLEGLITEAGHILKGKTI